MGVPDRAGDAWFSSALRPRFISFEGPEGSGKSTQAKILAAAMRAGGADVVLTREPGGTRIGEQVREILLSFSQDRLFESTEALLMTAARAQHVNEVIVPSLFRGWVITDRYVDSTYAYQGYGRGIDLDLLHDAQQLATGGVMPGVTILLDIDVSVGLERRLSSNDAFNRLDAESKAFHERVRTGYLNLKNNDPDRWIVVDAAQRESAIAADIWDALQRRFGPEFPALPSLVSGTSE